MPKANNFFKLVEFEVLQTDKNCHTCDKEFIVLIQRRMARHFGENLKFFQKEFESKVKGGYAIGTTSYYHGFDKFCSIKCRNEHDKKVLDECLTGDCPPLLSKNQRGDFCLLDPSHVGREMRYYMGKKNRKALIEAIKKKDKESLFHNEAWRAISVC